MLKSFKASDVELGSYVTDWAEIEEIKEVLLAKATLFVGELSLTTSNNLAQFSPEKSGSLFYGRALYNIPVSIAFDGVTAFSGYLKDIVPDHRNRTAKFVMHNVLTIPADSIVPPMTVSSVNPGSAILNLIKSVGLEGLADVPSILAAGGPALAAGATIDLNIEDGSSVSLLSILQQISDLCSISVFVRRGLIRARAFRPYQGHGAGLRQLIDATSAREFKERVSAYDNFNNKVTVAYAAGLSFSVSDPVSIAATKVTREYPFSTVSGTLVAVPDLTSAKFFASQALQRMCPSPTVITLEAGEEFLDADVGDRFPVTAENWGYVRAPFEAIEVHRSAEQLGVQMSLRSL